MDEAAYLSGHDPDLLEWLIDKGGVDARRDGDALLIEKASLREYQETLLEVAQGYWD